MLKSKQAVSILTVLNFICFTGRLQLDSVPGPLPGIAPHAAESDKLVWRLSA
jgi:hypothetical protein